MPVTLLGMVTDVAQGLHATTMLSFINNPSFVSSQMVAPQLSSLDNADLFTKAPDVK